MNLREYIKIREQKYEISLKHDLSLISFDVCVFRDLMPYVLQDSHYNLRSPQFQIFKYFQDSVAKDFIYDAAIAPNNYMAYCSSSFVKTKVRCRKDSMQFLEDIHLWYNTYVNESTTLLEIFNGTVNFEIAARHKSEKLLRLIPEKWLDNETKAKILFRVGSR